MLAVGLTGGIAAGKSEVSNRLVELGIPVVDADEVARAVVAPGSPTLALLVQNFGQSILDDRGMLDRAKMGELVFGDEQARSQLNALTHPVIVDTIKQRLSDLKAEGHSLAVVDAALMVESGSANNYPVLIVVHAPTETRLDRLMIRDGLSLEQAQSRVDAQMPQEQKMALAHHCIDNGGDRAHTRQQVDALVEQLLSQSRNQ